MFSEMGTRSVLNMTDLLNFFEPVKSTIKQLWLYSIPSLRSPYLKSQFYIPTKTTISFIWSISSGCKKAANSSLFSLPSLSVSAASNFLLSLLIISLYVSSSSSGSTHSKQ